jgi:lipoprotein Spr
MRKRANSRYERSCRSARQYDPARPSIRLTTGRASHAVFAAHDETESNMKATRWLLSFAALLLTCSTSAHAGVPLATLALSVRLDPGVMRAAHETGNAFPVHLKLEQSLAEGMIDGALDAGEAMIGTRYEFGADRDDAVDCSSLVRRMFSSVGKPLPRTTRELVGLGQPVKTDDLQPGDLVFYRFGKRGLHVAVLLDDHRLLHASPSKRQVVTTSLDAGWRGMRVAVRRIVGS